jgi:endoribonuclease Dicer
MKMPADCFTNVNVFWRRIDLEDGKVRAALQLPAQSVIKEEVLGDPQQNVKLAKQHAAFKACIKLYEHGELNDNLVPIDEKQKVEQYTEEYFSHWEDYKSDKKSAGTRNHRRYHNIKTPDVLQNSDPKIDAKSFLYRIIVRPKFETVQHSVKVFRELIENQREFGILTSKRIPRLSKMTLFQSFGEIEVEISPVPISVTIKSSEELKLLQNFHIAIFRDVLTTWENFLVLDKTSYLIVPLTVDAEIDWCLATTFQSVQHPRRLTYDEIKETDFSRNAYFHKVMNPVYRSTEQNYVIIDVPEHMTPLSPFPDENYSSYKDYIELRFSTNIFRDDQPMIEVKGISNNLNLFFPGTGASGKQRKHEKQNLTEHYIPEVCHNYKFPADFWLKATLLPSVCHRMNYLLLAEELRMWLIDEGIDRGMGQQIYQLDVDYGNYDQRETVLRDIEREREDNFKYAQFQELLKKTAQEKSSSGSSSDEVQHTKALLLWDRSKLPLDIDRNWLTVSEVDINYYCDFLNLNRNKKSPTSIVRLQQLNGSPTRHDRLLMDSDDRSDIKIIHLKGIVESVQQKNLIKVLTTSNAGDVFDMERYEVLGDGFLKFISSLYLYKKHDDWHEGYLTSLKGRLVSNRNLFYVGNNFGLSSMIKSLKFDTKESLPASTRLPLNAQKILEEDKTLLTKLLNISGPLSQEDIISGYMDTMVLEPSRNEPNFGITHDPFDDDDDEQVEKSMLAYIKQHYVGDKIIADAVEAFLGVVVQSLGIQAGLKMCQKLKILPDEENLGSLLTEKIPPRKVINSGNASNQRIINSKELEKIIGYKFHDPTYLIQALTHASFPVKTLGSYQQLEFLGDAVLDFLITSYITEQCKSMDPGKLTDLRSALVNNVTLACVVVRNGIHKFLRAQNLLLTEAIKKFVDYQSSQDHKVVLDQIILLETENDTQSAESVDIPKVIGDIFESIVGAVFLDSGMNLSATWKVIYGLLKDELHAFMEDVPIQIVRQLFEYQKGLAEPKFFKVEEIDEESVGVPLEITVRGERKMFLGIGKNRSVAKKCAAKLALKYLKNSLRMSQ